MERFDGEFFEQASSNSSLLLIQQFGVGLEGVDIGAATRLGIAVCNIPAHLCYNAQATAEHALLLTMMLLRGTHHRLPRQFAQRQLGGGWCSSDDSSSVGIFMPQTLFLQRVTVVGYGAVGSTLCRYLSLLGAHVTAVRRSWDSYNSSDHTNDDSNKAVHDVHDDSTRTRIKQSTNLDDELPTTDILILCCTLNDATHHLMNEHRLNVLLPKGALVINVGRGPLVEYNAIYRAIRSEHVAGFASDVGVGSTGSGMDGRWGTNDYKTTKAAAEPWDPHDALSLHDNTIFTPHVGGNCHVVVENMAKIVVDNLERILLHELPPHHWVNRPG
jgi:lactate dehydrogenase-like 2-hydroxyacid dehydrogenase